MLEPRIKSCIRRNLKLFVLGAVLGLAYLHNCNAAFTCPIGFNVTTFTDLPEPVCIQIKNEESYYSKYDRCRGNKVPIDFFRDVDSFKNYAISLGKNILWTDYKKDYADGPIINWSIGHPDMGKLRNFKMFVRKNEPEELCVAVDLTTNDLLTMDCNDKIPRYCVVDSYENSDPILWDCPIDYMSFASPVPSCLQPVRSKLRVTWGQAKDFCTKSNGHLPQRGYIYTNHGEFERSDANEVPMGIVKGLDETPEWAVQTNNTYSRTIPWTEWNFDLNSGFDVYSNQGFLKHGKWQWGDNKRIYFSLICEHFVELPMMNFDINFEGNVLKIAIDQKNVPESDIWCFTDSVSPFPTRINVAKVLNQSQYVATITESGFYWCLTRNTKEYISKESVRVLALNNRTPIDKQFVLKVNFQRQYNLDAFTEGFIKYLEDEMNTCVSRYFHDRKRREISRVYYPKSTTNQTLIRGLKLKKLLHGGRTTWSWGIFHLVSEVQLEKNMFSSMTDEFIVVDVRKVLECTNPKALIGESTPVQWDCSYRVCQGNFNEGAIWYTGYDSGCTQKDTTMFTTEIATTEETSTEPTTTNYTTTLLPTTTDITTTMSPDDQVSEVDNSLQSLLNGSVDTSHLATATNLINGILTIEEHVVIPPSILKSLDEMVDKVKLDANENHVKIVETNLALVVSEKNKNGSPVIGISVDRLIDESEGFASDSIHVLTEDNNLPSRNMLEILVNIPSSLMKNNDSRISFLVFKNDKAFSQNSSNAFQKVNSRVLSISISNMTKFEEGQYIDIHMKPSIEDVTNGTKVCAFWDIDSPTGGRWSTDGCELLDDQRNDGLDTCRCYHMTHFAEIIRSGETHLSEANVYALTVISFVGCSLSLLGLIIIGLTGMLFKSWRSDFSNKVWMHLSASVAILIIAFMVIAMVNFEKNEPVSCIIAGIAVHYSVLSSFCWMLVSAVLSYKRLVRVFTKSSSHRLLKACAFAWLTPILPIAILFAIDPDNYTEQFAIGYIQKSFCYPSGLGFWLSLFLPVALIVSANMVLFCMIIYSVFISSKIKRHGDTKQLYRSITVSFLLFYLFGLTWLFGLLSEYLVMSYLFCITGTIQGFVLFIFFVVGNKKTRDLWCVKLGIKPSKSIHVTSTTSRSFSSKSRMEHQVTISSKLYNMNSTRPRSLSGNFANIDSRFS